MLSQLAKFCGDCLATCISCNSGFGMPDDVFNLEQVNRNQENTTRETTQDPYTQTALVEESSNSNESIVSLFSQVIHSIEYLFFNIYFRIIRSILFT